MSCPITQVGKFSTSLQWAKRPGQPDTAYTWRQIQSGDDVLVNCTWSMTYDLEDFEFGTLTIDGTVRI